MSAVSCHPCLKHQTATSQEKNALLRARAQGAADVLAVLLGVEIVRVGDVAERGERRGEGHRQIRSGERGATALQVCSPCQLLRLISVFMFTPKSARTRTCGHCVDNWYASPMLDLTREGQADGQTGGRADCGEGDVRAGVIAEGVAWRVQ